MEDFTASRKTAFQINVNGNDDNGDGNETTITVKGGGRTTSKNRSIKYVCPKCGAIVRADGVFVKSLICQTHSQSDQPFHGKAALKQVNVVCGDCDVPFERA